MSREERQGREGAEREERGHGSKRGEVAQAEILNNLIEEVRTIDSEIDIIKQRMNLIIREINALKHVVLKERQELKELEMEQTQTKSRFESMLNIIKQLRGGEVQ